MKFPLSARVRRRSAPKARALAGALAFVLALSGAVVLQQGVGARPAAAIPGTTVGGGVVAQFGVV